MIPSPHSAVRGIAAQAVRLPLRFARVSSSVILFVRFLAKLILSFSLVKSVSITGIHCPSNFSNLVDHFPPVPGALFAARIGEAVQTSAI